MEECERRWTRRRWGEGVGKERIEVAK